MDGSHENPAINLHKEYMTSENIAGLFEKHSVPHPTFDHLTGVPRGLCMPGSRALQSVAWGPAGVGRGGGEDATLKGG